MRGGVLCEARSQTLDDGALRTVRKHPVLGVGNDKASLHVTEVPSGDSGEGDRVEEGQTQRH